MNWLFNSEKNEKEENEGNEGNEFYFFNSNDDLVKNYEFDKNSYSLEMINLDHKISDYEISYEDFKIYQNSNSTLKNSSEFICTENFKTANFTPDLSEKCSNNILLKRTWLDNKEKPDLYKNITRDFPNEISLKDKMKLKRENTKFLLSKTRRHSDYNHSSTSEGKDDEFNSDKNSSSYVAKVEEDDLKKSINNNKNKNKEFISTNKKEIIMQKNREAAHRSRMNKKLEFEYLKQNQNLLQEENHNLKNELNKYLIKSCKFCDECKKILKEESADNKIHIQNIQNIQNEKSKIVDKKFQVIQPPRILQNSIVPSGLNSRTGKVTLLTSLLVIVCLFGNLFWFTPDNTGNTLSQSQLNGRIMLENLNKTNIREEDTNYEIYKKVPDQKQIQNFPPVLIDDHHDSKSFYVLFMDYIKSRTGFTPSPYTHVNSSVSEIGLKKQFLPKLEKNLSLHEEACLNNKTFMKFTTDLDPLQQSNEDKKEKFLRSNPKQMPPQKKSQICNTTKFTGYFDLEFSKINPKNNIDKCKDFNTKFKQDLKSEK
jgi:glutaredoxin